MEAGPAGPRWALYTCPEPTVPHHLSYLRRQREGDLLPPEVMVQGTPKSGKLRARLCPPPQYVTHTALLSVIKRVCTHFGGKVCN